MENIHGKCVCGAVEIIIKEYGNFVYACHCDNCRRQRRVCHSGRESQHKAQRERRHRQ
jgi:hypothetical protein